MDDFKYSRVQDESKQANGTASREDETKRPTVSIAMEPLSSPKNSTLQAHDEDGSGNGGSYVSAQEGGYERVKDTHANFNHTTIDWFSDITKFRRRMKQEREQNKKQGWRGTMRNSWLGLQPWLVLFAVAFCTAVTGAFIHTGTEWVSTFKLGFCAEHGFWLSRAVCCVDSVGECTSWKKWHQAIMPGAPSALAFWFNYIMYIFWAVGSALLCCFIVRTLSPAAAGSGIAQVKVILGGFIIKGFLGAWNLFVKTVCLILSVGSGLSVGKEGPMVHVACSWGNIISRYFPQFSWNEAKKREVISAAAAAGVAVAFGAPLGGVLFSLEAVSSYFPHKTMWRAFFCAISSTVLIYYADPFSNGKLVNFEVRASYRWNWFELGPFAFLGMLGGLLGAMFIRIHIRIAKFRRDTTWFRSNAYREMLGIAMLTAILNFSNVFMRGSQTELLEALFGDCQPLNVHDDPEDLSFLLCEHDGGAARTVNMLLLLVAGFVRLGLLAITFGISVPAGLYVPSLAAGACIGRVLGWGMQLWYIGSSASFPFESCRGATNCVNPGIYAIIGAAAVLGGVTRLTISLAVIMFELTGGLGYIVPIMIALTCSKWVGDAFGKEGVYDAIISMQGYPYINPKMEADYNATASDIMSSNLVVVDMYALTLHDIDEILESHPYHGFPVVNNRRDRILRGWISRTDLQLAMEHAEKEHAPASTPIYFSSQPPSFPSATFLDFSRYVDKFPISVTPLTPASRIAEMFKGLGLRYIMVCEEGRLEGIIKKKDILLHMDPDAQPRLPRMSPVPSLSDAHPNLLPAEDSPVGRSLPSSRRMNTAEG